MQFAIAHTWTPPFLECEVGPYPGSSWTVVRDGGRNTRSALPCKFSPIHGKQEVRLDMFNSYSLFVLFFHNVMNGLNGML